MKGRLIGIDYHFEYPGKEYTVSFEYVETRNWLITISEEYESVVVDGTVNGIVHQFDFQSSPGQMPTPSLAKKLLTDFLL